MEARAAVDEAPVTVGQVGAKVEATEPVERCWRSSLLRPLSLVTAWF